MTHRLKTSVEISFVLFCSLIGLSLAASGSLSSPSPETQAAYKTVDFDLVLNSRLQLNSTADLSAGQQGQGAGHGNPMVGSESNDTAQAISLTSLVKTVDFILSLPDSLNISFSRVPELRKRSFWAVIALARRMQDENLTQAELMHLLTQLDERLQQLPNHLCWPIARRVIFAALVQRRLLQGPFSPAAQDKVRDLCVRLYRLHQQAAARKGVVDFFHVSKSGGTSFCELARINGCATQSFSQKRNCLIKEFDDAPRWVSKDVHAKRSPPNNMRSQWYANYGTRPRNPVSCPHRKRFMLKRHFNIYANEFTLLGGTRSPQSLHLCHHSVNVLQLRHPHHRLQSHLRWIWLMYRLSYGNNITSFFPSMKDGGQSVARDWEELAPAPTHNYYTRSLLGEATYRLPPENLTERHLHLARLVISQFDVLLLLEEPAMNDLLFQFALGWKFTLSSVKARSADGVESEALVGFALPSDFKAMLARNAIDLELYKFGFMLSLMDAVVFDIAKAAGIDPWASLGIQIGKSLYQPTGSYITEVGNTTQGTCGFVTLYDQEGPFSEDVLAV